MNSDTHINQARLLVLNILAQAKARGGYAIPESTLKLEVPNKTRPHLTDVEWADLIIELQQREFIGHIADDLDDEKKFFIKEAGQTALRS